MLRLPAHLSNVTVFGFPSDGRLPHAVGEP